MRNPVLLAFPYVNGGLFSRAEPAAFPSLDAAFADLLVDEAGAFDWREISPTIFGAVFESTLNPETRRRGGMHYTSVANIHKVIDPLFLDALRAELAEIRKTKAPAALNRKLNQYIGRLASIRFLDPACGSGNFLTETYISLRRLENEALEILNAGRRALALPIRVKIGQFAGIEVNGFAVAVARTALWIAESQMHAETADFCRPEQDLLPLRELAGIVEGNALRLEWPEADYIIGNPPFVGARMKNAEQRGDIVSVFGAKWPGVSDLDYVACWFMLAVRRMKERPSVRAALVATNSICQGGAVGNLWKPLLDSGVRIQFAWRTFQWDSESRGKAHVHCVIVGFGLEDIHPVIWTESGPTPVEQINGYLVDAGNVGLRERNTQLSGAPEIFIGNQPLDGGSYLFTDEEKSEFVAREPGAEKWFRPWYGSREFLRNAPRQCLWLRRCPPEELAALPLCLERVEAVRKFRQGCIGSSTRLSATTPTVFHAEIFPDSRHLVIPKVSSGNREYVPMGFLPGGVLCSDLLFIVPEAEECHFGILTSSAHNAWMRMVAGRLKSDYRYSGQIVYNNFPWPETTDAQRKRIATLAQGVLDARAAHPKADLATLYTPATMPPDLRRAHTALDRAVLALYGLKAGATEPEIVAELFKRYAALAGGHGQGGRSSLDGG